MSAAVRAAPAIERGGFAALLLALNAVPLVGVLFWDWSSFDLIFLYWLENLFIGLFFLLRFVVRPFEHMAEAAGVLMMAAFFTFHYGMFCFGHGVFVLALFGGDPGPAVDFDNPFAAILPVLRVNGLELAALALFGFQAADWVRDLYNHGMGYAGVKQLMVAPYRRIVVLHLTLIGSGFLLSTLHDPLAGLVLLVALKTGFDFYHWRRDELADDRRDDDELSPQIRERIDRLLDNPEITVNGRTQRFDSFEDLESSPHYRLLHGMLRIGLGRKQSRAVDRYIDAKLVERNQRGRLS